MARKFTGPEYKTIYKLICDCLPMEQRCEFVELRANNPERVRQLIERCWDENMKQLVKWFMKKEEDAA